MGYNVYYQPENLGLSLLTSLDEGGLSYEYNTLIVLRHDATGRLFHTTDSGCSCPTPFEFDHFNSPDDHSLKEITKETLVNFKVVINAFPVSDTERYSALSKVISALSQVGLDANQVKHTEKQEEPVKTVTPMLWFRFRQNNSGGSFSNNPFNLVVEAASAQEANHIAEQHIYFDGCSSGVDCGCCGDRWSRVSGEAADNYEIFTTEQEAIDLSKDQSDRWMKDPVIKVVRLAA